MIRIFVHDILINWELNASEGIDHLFDPIKVNGCIITYVCIKELFHGMDRHILPTEGICMRNFIIIIFTVLVSIPSDNLHIRVARNGY
ncbi:hypothetical protein D3C76_1634690 [compost metagenome]